MGRPFIIRRGGPCGRPRAVEGAAPYDISPRLSSRVSVSESRELSHLWLCRFLRAQVCDLFGRNDKGTGDPSPTIKPLVRAVGETQFRRSGKEDIA